LTDPYVRIKSFWITLLSRDDFERMLSADSLASAVKAIAYKPLGTALYNVIARRVFSFVDLDKAIAEFNEQRITTLAKLIDRRTRETLEQFTALFDIVNLYYIVVNLSSGGKASLIYPFGRLVSLDLSSISSLSDLLGKLPEDLLSITLKIKDLGVREPLKLLTIYQMLKPEFTGDESVKLVYAFLRDLMMLKTCLSAKTDLRDYYVTLYTMAFSDYVKLCSVPELAGLPPLLHSIRPYYGLLASILSDIFKVIRVSPTAVDLGIALFMISLSADLITTVEQVTVRTYLLYLGETVLARTTLASIDSGIFVDGLKEVVRAWWPL